MKNLAAVLLLLIGGICHAQLFRNNPVICRTYTISFTNAAFIAKSATPDITLFSLPAKHKMLGASVKHSVLFDDGTGPMSAATVSVGDSSGATAYTAAFDIFQAVSATTYQDTSLFKSTTSVARDVLARFTSTGSNFGVTASAITAASNAAAASLTSTAHGLQTGNSVTISGATGSWTPINDTFSVTRTGADTFTIPVDSTTFGALTGSPVIGAQTFLTGGSVAISICTARLQ